MTQVQPGIVRVLLVEDDPDDSLLIQEMLAQVAEARFHLECSPRLSTALQSLEQSHFDVLLLDLSLPDAQGLEAFSTLHRQAPEVPVVVLTGLEDAETGLRAVQEGAQDYLFKGHVDSFLLSRSLRYAIERHELLTDVREKARLLEKSEARSRKLIQENADGVVIIDRKGTIQFANPAAGALFRRPPEELIGEYAGIPLAPEGPAPLDIPHGDGEPGAVEMEVAEIEWEGEAAYLASLRDVREERRIKALQRSEQYFRSLIENALDVIAVLNEDTTIRYVSPSVQQVLGYAAEALTGRNVFSLLHPDDLAAVSRALAAGIPNPGSVAAVEVRLRHQDGSWRIIQGIGKNLLHHSAVAGVVVNARDVTASRELEQAVLEIREKEQHRIGQDLHDGLCQRLTGIAFMSNTVEEKLLTRSLPEAEDVALIAERINESIAEARSLIRGLHPVDLAEQGLPAALDQLAADTERLYGTSCVFKCQPGLPGHDSAAATHLYRIAQEALSNAAKHGKASQILIELARTDETTVLTIRDDGIGLPEEIEEGIGIQSMRSRAGALGASLEVRRHPEGGTIVICSL